MDILTINNLIVAFETPQGELTAVKGVSLSLAQGETLALVGESGCGKTVLCKSMLKILCERGRIKEGEILLSGQDLVPFGEKEMVPYRGRDVAMIFQDPMSSLDPTMSVGRQIAEAAEGRAEDPKARALELMRLVEIDHPQQRYDQMPHHFSGGMRQRIAIAIALAGDPKILLADEPTTSLDAGTQEQILKLLKKIDIATIFITHDLSLVEDIADRVAIMKDGNIVETGPVEQVFSRPQNPYTKKLLGYLDYGKGRGHSHKHSRQSFDSPLAEVRDLKKYFSLGRHAIHKALDGFSLDIYKGEILGLVGPSGCGKSTLARCLMGIYEPTGGEIRFFNEKKSKNWRQMIFQDSDSAFNPRMTIGQIIGEPLRIAEGKQPEAERIARLMEQVELDPALMERHPYDVSGGQRQRAAIARAISVDPEFIVADEPISSLDISTQAQIVHLFRRLQEERNLTILFIAHDLPMVNHISDRIVEMGV
ncbi:ABC transporter ATP-binding protein [Anaerovorax odorimutans]|uniref:ABC transporter ATP-binding protein n=1 Tax=Anaerovorax odorimutans TaxID=109327 RepID=A0ABT1RNK2_9FIRM|nr:ABC transporter ATP-binding protein [Anaerovorax odorimutans]MCQ4636744.1 ABC transporter ATP-binding protein [Anaerovorax odorimutans]